jgi:hypothetical protein
MTRLIIPLIFSFAIGWPSSVKAEEKYIFCKYLGSAGSGGLQVKLVDTFWGGTKVYYLFLDEFVLTKSKVTASSIEFSYPMPKVFVNNQKGSHHHKINRMTGEIKSWDTGDDIDSDKVVRYINCNPSKPPKF